MKTFKILAFLMLLLIILAVIIYVFVINNKKENYNLKKYNLEYEKYLNKTVSGVELATLINKAVNENEKNGIQKDKKEHYIENDVNSIKIVVTIELTKKTYSMEEFYNNDTGEFVKHFSEEKFYCNNIEYHKKTKKISKIHFTQVENK